MSANIAWPGIDVIFNNPYMNHSVDRPAKIKAWLSNGNCMIEFQDNDQPPVEIKSYHIRLYLRLPGGEEVPPAPRQLNLFEVQ